MIRNVLRAISPEPVRRLYRSYRDRGHARRNGLVVQPYSGRLRPLGTIYGGYVVPEEEIKAGDVFYCLGAGEDISFELLAAARYHVEVHIFDPTPRARTFVEQQLARLRTDQPELASRCHFHALGVWSEDCEMKFFAPKDPTHVSHSILNMQHTEDYFLAQCRTPRTIMEQLGHKKIDLLKLNIEGAEYAVMDSIFASGTTPRVVCINFDELHTQIDSAAHERLHSLIDRFLSAGYVPVSVQGCRATYIHRQS